MTDAPVTAYLLRCRLGELLAGAITLADFDEWLTQATWDADGVAPDVAELACHMGLLIDEYSGGAWTWPELRDRLATEATTIVMTWGASAEPRITTGATSPVIRELDLAAQT
jgi:hypothetical protein